MEIGKIVSSISHQVYICQIFSRNETREPVSETDYALGQFVAIGQSGAGSLVALVTNTLLYNPDFGNLGPKLTPRTEMDVFTPDYLAEKVTLVYLMLVGAIDNSRAVTQGIPAVGALADAPVRLLGAEEIELFHHPAGKGLALNYLPLLMASGDPLVRQVAAVVVSRLAALYPGEAPRLALLEETMAWTLRIEPLR